MVPDCAVADDTTVLTGAEGAEVVELLLIETGLRIAVLDVPLFPLQDGCPNRGMNTCPPELSFTIPFGNTMFFGSTIRAPACKTNQQNIRLR